MRCSSLLSSVVSGLALVAVCTAPAIGSTGTLYAISPFYSEPQLYSLDTATGRPATRGGTGALELIDLVADVSNRLLAVRATETGSAFLYEVDSATGSATGLRQLNLPEVYEGGLAIAPDGGGALLVSHDRLFSLNLSSGQASLIGRLTLGGNAVPADANIDALAFRGQALFGFVTVQSGALDGHLVTIDPATGSMTDIGSVGVSFGGTAGLAYNAREDYFYLAGRDVPGLYRVDPHTARATLIGLHGLQDVAGLAFIPAPVTVPEPSMLLGGAALAALAIRPRRPQLS